MDKYFCYVFTFVVFSFFGSFYVSAQPAPSGFEADSVVCSSTNRNNGRTAWDAKDGIIGRRNWDSGLTIQEYSELKELPYESTRRWIRVLQKT